MVHGHQHRHAKRVPNLWDDFVGGIADTFTGGKAKDDDKNNGGVVTTIVRTRVQTLGQTFEGDIGGFTTFPQQTQAKGPAMTQGPKNIPDEITDPDVDSVPATLAVAGDTAASRPTFPANTANSQLPGNTNLTQAEASSNGGGSSTATKAGIAIGVLAAFLILFALGFFIFSRRKKRSERQSLEDDEKLNGPFGHGGDEVRPVPPPKAPRISLRPVTQFLPTLNLDKRTSKGGFSGSAAPAAGAPTSPWERPMTAQSTNPNNPFGNQAERVYTPIQEEARRPVSPLDEGGHPMRQPVSPLDDQHATFGQDPLTAHGPAITAGAAAGAAAAIAAARRTSRSNMKPLDLTLPAPIGGGGIPPSPANTEFSMHSVSPGQNMGPSSSAAAIAAAGGPAGSVVHRVQLDFVPTLEDEMGLRAGELVRLLHEYDDGWALCIRLDRTKQGVVPRTCLSTRPVKPRPQNGGPRGPPINPQGRPMTPQSGQMHSQSESPFRPSTAQGRPASPAGSRSMSPAPRTQSPGPRYQTMPPQRSQSPSGHIRKGSPPGPSPMNPFGDSPPQNSQSMQQPRPGPPTGPVGRKPVPGMAY